MLSLKHVSLFKGTRNFVMVLLIGILFLTSSAFVQPQGQTSDPYEKQLPANGERTQLPQALAPAEKATAANIIQDPSFEASYGMEDYWIQDSTIFGTPLCIPADCGNGAGTAGPRSGSVWGWFGGYPFGFEHAELLQHVMLPSCGATLRFYFWIGRASPGSDAGDYFRVSLNGNVQLFRSDATQKNSYAGYTLVTANIIPGTYALGVTNALKFESITSDQTVNFNLDDVTLIPNCVTIGGFAGVGGTRITYTGGSTTADEVGNYAFNVPGGWSGTVTPSKSGYRFSPASRTYSNVMTSQLGQYFTAIPLYSISGNTGVGGVTLSYTDGTPKTVTSQGNGNYSLSVPQSWNGTVTPSHPCFTFNPTSLFYGNVLFNQTGQDFTPTFVPASGCADIDVSIGGTGQGRFGIPSPGGTRASFSGVSNGPVNVESTNAVSLIGAERVIYKVNNVNTSFTEVMGLPNSQLDTTYWLPWYNNVDLDTQLRFANVSNSQATVHVYIGGDEMQDSPFILEAGASTRKSFEGINSGPVQIVSDMNIVAAERVIYKVNNVNTSFSEMMALPNTQLDTTYWLPWYNNVDLDTQLRFANVSDQPASVHVSIGGVEMDGSPFVLLPGESTRKSFPGINDGPVKIESDQDIVAAERVIYKVNGVNTSFTEMMALPNSQLDTTYWLPWYNNKDLDTQLRFANTTDQTATVHVYIGGVEMPNSPFTLLPGESTRQSFANINNGPVQIVSDVPIVAAERLIYKVNNINTSFSEMMALPASQLHTTYWLPWYNNVDLDTQLRFGIP